MKNNYILYLILFLVIILRSIPINLINNVGKLLLKTNDNPEINYLTNENIKLKEAIRELISDLKEKENSLEQSQKIITKIKDEYTKIIKKYQELENEIRRHSHCRLKLMNNYEDNIQDIIYSGHSSHSNVGIGPDPELGIFYRRLQVQA